MNLYFIARAAERLGEIPRRGFMKEIVKELEKGDEALKKIKELCPKAWGVTAIMEAAVSQPQTSIPTKRKLNTFDMDELDEQPLKLLEARAKWIRAERNPLEIKFQQVKGANSDEEEPDELLELRTEASLLDLLVRRKKKAS